MEAGLDGEIDEEVLRKMMEEAGEDIDWMNFEDNKNQDPLERLTKKFNQVNMKMKKEKEEQVEDKVNKTKIAALLSKTMSADSKLRNPAEKKLKSYE
jgi:phosphotransacetylase